MSNGSRRAFIAKLVTSNILEERTVGVMHESPRSSRSKTVKECGPGKIERISARAAAALSPRRNAVFAEYRGSYPNRAARARNLITFASRQQPMRPPVSHGF